MPTSHPSQLNEIIGLVMTLDPRSVLDVGVGFGKYGVLIREYLELWDGRERYHEWTRRIDGIEIFDRYLTPLHAFVYDTVHVGNAADVLPTIATRFDLILLIDVIEHFTREDGLRFLDLCISRARNVIISTPKDMGGQSEAFQNPHETHRSQWKAEDFRAHPHCVQIHNRESLIFLIGADAAKVRPVPWTRVIRRFPLLRSTLGRIRRALAG